ncbi:SMP-30/gluconolactonase/LRE family protein [SAR202 cluster bacterium AD-804-J14_MRT_500m]|nr:SMP-30/gluconolactonase/LRE family protein [SAR202 cluster bacterium AD-804-J14_MRT_500m]
MNFDMSSVLETYYPELLATGFVFTEGPVWVHDGFLYFVDIHSNRQLRWSRNTGSQVVREDSGGGNGTTMDGQGRMIICEGANRRVTRKEKHGSWVPIAETYLGNRFNRPNDVVCHSNGNIYFTDPGARVLPYEREIDFSGVFMVSSDGSLSLATSECEYPNGLAFSPDESVMYVAISRLDGECIKNKANGNVCNHQLIRAFDVEPDGSLSNNRVFAELFSDKEGVPDGMKVDVKGRVYCTGPGGCWVYEADGSLIGIIQMPEVPANVAFGGSDWRDLYFTARTSIYMFRANDPGIKVPT